MSNQSSSRSTAYTSSRGAGGSSSASAQSADGQFSSSQDSIFVPGATSGSATADASSRDQGIDTSAQVSVPDDEGAHTADESDPSSDGDPDLYVVPTNSSYDFVTGTFIPAAESVLLLGTPDTDSLQSTPYQDFMWGSDGSDVFQLGPTGATTIQQADFVLDFNSLSGDQLALGGDLTFTNIAFEIVDTNGNGMSDSTAIRSLIDNSILGTVVNTVGENGQTLLSIADFTNLSTIAVF